MKLLVVKITIPDRVHPRCTLAAGDELVFSCPENLEMSDGIFVGHFDIWDGILNSRQYRARIATIWLNGVAYVVMPQLDYEILSARNEMLEMELAQLEEKRKKLELERVRLDKERALLDQKLARLEKECEDLGKRQAELQKLLDMKNEEIEAKEEEIEAREEEFEARKEEIEARKEELANESCDEELSE